MRGRSGGRWWWAAAPVRLVVAVVWLLTQTPVVPAVVAGAALLEGGHRVECELNEGALRVRLVHWQPGPGAAHPGWLGVLVRPAPHHPDHCYEFAPPGLASGESDGLRATAEEAGGAAGFVWLPEFLAGDERAARLVCRSWRVDMGSMPAGRLVGLRSVVMLV